MNTIVLSADYVIVEFDDSSENDEEARITREKYYQSKRL